MIEVKHKLATGLGLWLMKKRGFSGFTSYWSTVYYIDREAMNNTRIRKHELKHIEQMEREGNVLFTIKYLYYLIKDGYRFNKYEVEARRAEYE
jgi:hypothetical protein